MQWLLPGLQKAIQKAARLVRFHTTSLMPTTVYRNVRKLGLFVET
jgi:hypothetical protein